MLQDFFKALSLILFAEMGDKTQIIAMTFATMYRMKDILAGVALGAGLNHAIAIILGVMLTKFISLDFLQLIAGVVFIVFAILSISCEEEDEEEDSKKKLSPIMTVALAFFIGELGDKTQISALTLSLDSNYPGFVLLGTTSGMVLTSLLGIIIGGKLGKKIPEFQLKVAAFLIFLAFGMEKLINSKYVSNLGIHISTMIIATIILFSAYKLYSFYRFSKVEKTTLLKERAEELYNLKHVILKRLEEMCLNNNNCTNCIGGNCVINFMRGITEESIKNNHKISNDDFERVNYLLSHSSHSKQLAEDVNEEINLYLEKFSEEKDNDYIKIIKQTLEKILSK